MLSRLNVVRLKMIRFRPLSGSYISQWNVKSIIKFYIIQSFRPLSGSYISQQCKNQMLDSTAKMFPSPIGELHFSMILIIYKKGGKNVSVPYRGATFLNWHQTMAHVQCVVTVSVPYRGATFLNVITNFIKSTTAVSVPYRGATFLNREGRVRLLMDTLFPSPIGELHFSIRDN